MVVSPAVSKRSLTASARPSPGDGGRARKIPALVDVGLGLRRVAAVGRFGISTARLNSATRVPSCLKTRVWTRTMPRSGFEVEGRTSSTSDSQ